MDKKFIKQRLFVVVAPCGHLFRHPFPPCFSSKKEAEKFISWFPDVKDLKVIELQEKEVSNG